MISMSCLLCETSNPRDGFYNGEKTLHFLGLTRLGVEVGAVDGRGNVHPDQFWWHYLSGNVRQREFGGIWTDISESLLLGLRKHKGLPKGRCAWCQYLDLCNGNFRVRAEAVFGDVWAEDPACYLSDEEIGTT